MDGNLTALTIHAWERTYARTYPDEFHGYYWSGQERDEHGKNRKNMPDMQKAI